MSKQVDERVVEMRFDNKQFESATSETMSTLDKLKQKLQLKDASKGLNDLEKAAKKVDLNPLSKAAETVTAKFSALQVAGVTALANITNSAVNAGKNIVKAFTIDPVKMGLEEYETQINAVQTILSNTRSKGTTIDQVNDALDELNHYADMTIYNFTEMTRNIGTFTAAGVDLDTSVSAIKGIANLAAVSGSTSLQASTAMYQLSQALAAGKVQLMDWNSVVNAGMGGQVFQDALKETARVHGVAIDDMIKEEGSFRETLQHGWLTAEVLTETLSKFTGDLTEEQIKSMGYTEEQAKSIIALGKDANDAATKVKTFTQLLDTLKEAAQSGWTQTWEILIGDFEEAKALWTSVSDTLSEMLNKSAETRNNMLQGWKDAGGRAMLVDSFKNAFEGLMNIITPVKEAFREIFPPTTSEQLLKITERIRDLTAGFKELTEKNAPKLKATFKGIFSVIKVGVTIIKSIVSGVTTLIGKFTGVSGGILSISAAFGNFTSRIAGAITESNLFGKAIDKLVGFLSLAIDKFKEFTGAIKEKIDTSNFEWFFDLMKGIWEVVQKIGGAVGTALAGIGKALGSAFRNGDVKSLLDILNGGLFASILIGIRKYIGGITESFEGPFKFMDKIKDILGSVEDSLKSWQQNLQAGTLIKIASAIAILAGSLWILSSIEPGKLTPALTGITILFGELVGAMALFSKIEGLGFGAAKAVTIMLGMATSILILSSAMVKLGSLDWNGIAKGLTGVTVMMGAMVGAMILLSKFAGESEKLFSISKKGLFKSSTQKNLISVGLAMIAMAAAIKILASACEDLGSMDWNGIAKGLTGIIVMMGVATGAMIALSKFTGGAKGNKNLISVGLAMIAMAGAMKIFASAAEGFSKISWGGLGKAGAAITGILAIVAGFVKLSGYGNKMIRSSVALVIIGASMEIFADVCSKFGNMSWPDLGKAGAAMGGILALASGFVLLSGLANGMTKSVAALTIIAVAMEIFVNVAKKFGEMDWESIGKAGAAMGGILALATGFALLAGLSSGILTSAAALLVMAVALKIFTPVMVTLGNMSWGEIVKGLIAIAGAFAIIGVAGAVLGPLVPSILALSGAITLFGIGCLAAGVGITLFATGFAALAAAVAGGATALVAGLTVIIIGILDLIPSIINEITAAIVAICNVIIQSAPAIGKAIKAIVLTLIDVLVECIPAIADGALKLVLGVLDALVAYTPKIVDRLFQFLIGILDGLGRNVPKLISAFVNMLMSIFEGAMDALNGIDIDTFVKGVKCIGMLTTIALALSALAVLAPLAMVGVVALGAVIAELGLVIAGFGKIAQKFPELQSLIQNGSILLEAIGDAIGKFVGGIIGGIAEGVSDSLPKVATNLSNFMTNLQPFIDGANKIKPSMFDGVKTLLKVILAITAEDLLQQITSKFTGTSSLSTFTKQLVPFGKAMAAFSASVSGKIDEGAITSTVNAGKMIAELNKSLPKTGGVVGFFTGNKKLDSFGEQLVAFGRCLTKFSKSISGDNAIDSEAITAAANAGKIMAEMNKTLPETGGVLSYFTANKNLDSFGSRLVVFGKCIAEFSKSVSGDNAINGNAVIAAANAGKIMAELNSSLPKTGGLVSFFKGDKNLSSFGMQLVAFGRYVSKFSKSISGDNAINGNAVEIAANAGKMMVELNKTLPKTGGLVSFLKGDKSIASFGMQLVTFGKCIAEFSRSISGDNVVNGSAVEVAANAGRIMIELNKTLPKTGGLVSFFKGDKNLSSFGMQLVTFGKCIAEFSRSISGDNVINGSAVEVAANAGKIMIAMNDALPKTGGLVSFFKGDKDMASFGVQLVAFGRYISKFSKSISGDNAINGNAVEVAANAGKMMVEMNEALPKTGGLISFFTGKKSMASFGVQLVAFGKYIAEFSRSISGDNVMNGSAVEIAANAGKMMAELNKTIPKTGGLVSFFKGDKDMGSFGTQLVVFGKCIADFSESVSGKNAIDEAAVASATNAGTMLAALAEVIPEEGAWDSLMSALSITTTGDKIVAFADVIKRFSAAMTAEDAANFDEATVVAAANAGTQMAKMAEAIPKEGGIWEKIIGTRDIKTFGEKVLAFAEIIKEFSAAMTAEDTNFDATLVTAAANAGTKMIDMAKLIPEEGGIFDNLAGTKDIASFGEKVLEFAKSIMKVSNLLGAGEVTFNEGVVTAAAKAGQGMADIATTIPKEGGEWQKLAGTKDIATFGEKVVAFATSLMSVSTVLSSGKIKFDSEVVTAAVAAGQGLTDIAKAIPKEGGAEQTLKGSKDIAAFGQKVVVFAECLKEFSKTAGGISTESIDSVVNSTNKLITMVKRIANDDASKFTAFVSSLGDIGTDGVDGFIEAFSESGEKAEAAGQEFIESISKGITTALKNSVESAKSYYLDFYKVGQYLVEGFASGITTNTFVAEASSRAMAKAAYDAAKSELDVNSPSKKFMTVGKYVVEGFGKGITKNVGRVNDAAVKMGKSVLKATQNYLGIHSPSIVFNKEVGRYIVQGIAEGIEADMSAEEAAEQKAQNIINAFKKVIDSNNLDSDIAKNAFDIWSIGEGKYASGDVKDTKQLEYLTGQIPRDSKNVQLMKDKWLEMKTNFGATDDRTKEAYKEYQAAIITQQETLDAIADISKNAADRQNSIWSQEMSNLDADYDLWESMYGDYVSEKTKNAQRRSTLIKKVAIQDKIAEDANKKLIEIENTYGKNSSEWNEQYGIWKNEKKAASDLRNEIRDIDKETRENIKDAREIERSIADTQYDTWLKTEGRHATDAEKDAKKLENLNLSIASLNKDLLEAQKEYEDICLRLGKNSDEAQKKLEEVTNINNQIATKTDETAQIVEDAIQREKDLLRERQELVSDTADLQYQIWEKIFGRDATDAEKDTAKLGTLNKQAIAQSNILAQVQQNLEEAIKTYGSDSIEAQRAYNEYLQEEYNLAQLHSDILDIEESIADREKRQQERQRNAKNEYLNYMDKYKQYYLDHGMTLEELENDAKLVSGYDPDKIINKTISDASKSVSKVINGHEYSNILSNFSDIGTSYATSMSEGVSSGTPQVISSATTMVSDCTTTLKETQPTWIDTGKYLLGGFVEGLEETSKDVRKKVIEISDSATFMLRLKFQDWYETASYLVSGFIQGIRSRIVDAAYAAAEMARAALAAAEEALDINSPSKEFARVGAYAVMGMVEGLKDNTYLVADAATNVGDVAIENLKNSIKNISDIVNSEIDTQPTIRPVLDLSDVTSKASTLDAMVSRTQAMRISNEIARSNAQNIQNGTDTDSASGNTYQFTQNNYSPKALSRIEIYRQTKNQFAMMKGMV